MSWRKYLLALLLVIGLPVLAEAACPVPNVYPFVAGCPLPSSGLNAAIAAGSTLPDTTVTPGAYTCANVTFDPKGRATAAANGSCTGGGGTPGGSSGQIQYNNSSVFGGVTLTAGNGIVLSGTANSKIQTTAADATDTNTTSYTVVAGNTGGAERLAATSGTPALILPAVSATIFQPGMSFSFVIGGTVPYTVTNSTGLVIKNLNSTTLPPGTSGTFVANTNATDLDFYPGMQPPTATALGGVSSNACPAGQHATGAFTAAGVPSCSADSGGGGGGIVLPNSIGGCVLSNDGGTPNTKIDIAACVAADSANAAYISAGAFVKSTGGAWTSGTGNNGMGNGLTIAASTVYYICLTDNGGAADYYIDTSITCANKPAGVTGTVVRNVAAFVTDGSANILAFAQVGDRVDFTAERLIAGSPITINTTTTPVSLLVPGSVMADFTVYSATSNALLVTSTPGATGQQNLNSGFVTCGQQATGGTSAVACGQMVLTNTSGQIQATTNANTAWYFNVKGWNYVRGQ